MKSVYIIGAMVNDTPTTKIKMFRFSTLLLESAQKKIKTEDFLLSLQKIHLPQ